VYFPDSLMVSLLNHASLQQDRDERSNLDRLKGLWPNILLMPAHSSSYGISLMPPSALIQRDYAAEATYAHLRAQQKWKGPFCNDTGDSHIVTYGAAELLHEKKWEMPLIIAYIWPTGSSIDYWIHAKELPRRLEGQLHINRVSGHSALCISRMELEVILGSRHVSPHHPRYVATQREQGRNGKPTSQCAPGVQGTPAGERSVR